MNLATIEDAARQAGLGLVGAFHPQAEDGVPEGIETLCLLGPDGPAMWEAFTGAPEHSDGQPDPLDRWSSRVIDGLANAFGATAFYPFGGPPWQPFQKWATRGEGAVSSPVSMQVTSGRGLWASYRGALGFGVRLELPAKVNTSPCEGCHAPCLTTCPVSAFEGGGYDVPTCTRHIGSDPAMPCRSGCLVRKACPFGAAVELPVEQRAFHIDAFLRANGGTG